jgi:hypothetical protein
MVSIAFPKIGVVIAAVVKHRVVISTNLDDYDKAPAAKAGTLGLDRSMLGGLH